MDEDARSWGGRTAVEGSEASNRFAERRTPAQNLAADPLDTSGRADAARSEWPSQVHVPRRAPGSLALPFRGLWLHPYPTT
jgi:hypothetical protein